MPPGCGRSTAETLVGFGDEPGRAVRCVRCGALARAGAGPELPLYCPAPVSRDTADEVEDEPLLLRPSLGRYTLAEELGRGGMGVVRRGFDPELRREVAIKLLPAVSPGRRERFLREARTAAALDDPGVVRVHDAGRTEDGVAWLAMALVRGPTLEAVIHDAGALPADEAVRIAAVLARTLERLHARGLVHRDLKPSNVLITPRGEPLLSDFGLALDLAERARLTAEGDHAGTASYTAPELFEPRPDADLRLGDVYALGLVLSEMLVGIPTAVRLAGRMPDGSPWLDRIDHRVPPALAAIVRAAASPDPARRYPSAAALAADLERHLRGEPTSAYQPSLGARLGRRLARHRDRLAASVATGLALALLAGAVQAAQGWQARTTLEAREQRAAERLDQAWARRDELARAGRAAEADAVFEAFVAAADHQGTEAWAEAWLRRGRERAEADPDAAGAALARALYGARDPERRRAAAEGLAGTLRAEGRWDDLAVLLDELAPTRRSRRSPPPRCGSSSRSSGSTRTPRSRCSRRRTRVARSSPPGAPRRTRRRRRDPRRASARARRPTCSRTPASASGCSRRSGATIGGSSRSTRAPARARRSTR